MGFGTTAFFISLELKKCVPNSPKCAWNEFPNVSLAVRKQRKRATSILKRKRHSRVSYEPSYTRRPDMQVANLFGRESRRSYVRNVEDHRQSSRFKSMQEFISVVLVTTTYSVPNACSQSSRTRGVGTNSTNEKTMPAGAP